ncbi:MAG: cytochrome b [Oceanospirillaceae bacterium]|nr:cytochrome b [Oceanospirillaceae bacterium]MBT13237.1 cytochrome b [Oceanospirillaceae bacterium]|tara:strand:+ start:25002 stop:25565 length:564 start_codon:yes stop_codon:yes gene_type:complete
MMTENTNRSYTATAKAIHWLMALLILVASAIGLYSGTMEYGADQALNEYKGSLITLHKQIATLTIFLIALRIVWRITHRPPALTGMSPAMVKAAHAGHLLLYALMVIIPLAGWALSSSAGYPIPVAGLFNLPPLVSESEEIAAIAGAVHRWGSWLFLAVIAGHIGFAIKHKLVDRDGTMESMLPGKR